MSLSGCQLHRRWRTKNVGHKFYKCVFVTKKNPGTAGRRCPTRQLTCRSQFPRSKPTVGAFLCFCIWKKKKKEGMSCPDVVLPFSSQTLWAEGFFPPRIKPTCRKYPQCNSRAVASFHRRLWMFSTFCAGEWVCVRVYVLVEKCTNQIQNKMIFYATFFSLCWKNYIYSLALF